MAERTYQDPWVKKAKSLTQALIISATLNVGLLSTFIYFAVRQDPSTKLKSRDKGASPAENLDLQALIASYSARSLQDLLAQMVNCDHVESGLTKRDIALSCLVAFRHFNLDRALGGINLQKREITFTQNDKQIPLAVFPGLADYQFEAIVQYAKTERWPLTPQGLFLEIQSTKPPYDSSLLEAFYLSPEFHFLSLLFSKTGIGLKNEHIVALLASGDWATTSATATFLRQTPEFSLEVRRKFLLELVEQKSRLAAKILIDGDQEYCVKALDNEQVLALCDLLGEKTTPAFLKELLLSPRNDEIWQKAAAILYDQAAEERPEALNLELAKKRFIELKAIAPKTVIAPPVIPVAQTIAPKKATTAKTYTVAAGDSLWKIANKHHTTVQAIKEKNRMSTDKLKVGQTLLVP